MLMYNTNNTSYSDATSHHTVGSFAGPGHAGAPSSKVMLSVSAFNLKDVDTFSVSDPFCVLFIRSAVSNKWHEIARTEIIWNNLNPKWVEKFKMDYYFEEVQNLKFAIYDADHEQMNRNKLSKGNCLGEITCHLGEVVARETPLKKNLTGVSGVSGSSIMIRAEEIVMNNDILTLEFSGVKLDKKDWFGKSDPFFTFSRSNEDGSYTLVHKSEVIKVTLNPKWSRFTASVSDICNGDVDREILVQVYDWNKNGRHVEIGSTMTTVRELENNVGHRWGLVNEKIKRKKGSKYKNSGVLSLNYSLLEKRYTFIEYLQGGMEMNFDIGIDFTQSNGKPQDSFSLHYINNQIAGHVNEYAIAIKSVGEIIQDYDTDKLFPVYGFGARLPPNRMISHNFNVNFNPNDPNCHKIEGVLEAYERCIRSVELWGPTNFAPIIKSVSDSAAQDMSGKQYWVLLMITDGIISDMESTKKVIVEAADRPMSIIIIGVGSADFSAMEELDGDDVRLSYNNKAASRDIVQFVPIRDFIDIKQMQNQSMSRNRGNYIQRQLFSQAKLAQEVLQEIPEQVTEWMYHNKIVPSHSIGYADPYQSESRALNNNQSVSVADYSSRVGQSSSNFRPPPSYEEHS